MSKTESVAAASYRRAYVHLRVLAECTNYANDLISEATLDPQVLVELKNLVEVTNESLIKFYVECVKICSNEKPDLDTKKLGPQELARKMEELGIGNSLYRVESRPTPLEKALNQLAESIRNTKSLPTESL
jgi:hypothetical protein